MAYDKKFMDKTLDNIINNVITNWNDAVKKYEQHPKYQSPEENAKFQRHYAAITELQAWIKQIKDKEYDDPKIILYILQPYRDKILSFSYYIAAGMESICTQYGLDPNEVVPPPNYLSTVVEFNKSKGITPPKLPTLESQIESQTQNQAMLTGFDLERKKGHESQSAQKVQTQKQDPTSTNRDRP